MSFINSLVDYYYFFQYGMLTQHPKVTVLFKDALQRLPTLCLERVLHITARISPCSFIQLFACMRYLTSPHSSP